MFAGKTSKVIELVKQAQTEGKRVQCFRSLRDTRCRDPELRSHDGVVIPAVLYETMDCVRKVVRPNTQVMVFDEINMAPQTLFSYCLSVLEVGTDVIVSGLLHDYRGLPFPPTIHFVRVADRIFELAARCACGEPAHHTKRLVKSDDLIAPGGSDMYAPVCSECFHD